MPNFREGPYDSRKAGADLTTSQLKVVKLDTNGNAVLAAASTDPIHGVLVNAPKANETADIATINGAGTFKVKCGAAVAQFALLTANASGLAVGTTTAGDTVFGRALTAGATGDVIEYLKLNERF